MHACERKVCETAVCIVQYLPFAFKLIATLFSRNATE